MPENVSINLKPVKSIADRKAPNEDVLKEEYAAKYLQLIGADNTPANVHICLKELPITKALVVPIWAREQVAIFPGMGGVRENDKEQIVKNMYKPKEDSKKKRRNVAVEVPKKKKESAKKKNDNDGGDNVMEDDKQEEDDKTGAIIHEPVDPVTPGAEKMEMTAFDLKMKEIKAREMSGKPREISHQPRGRKVSWTTVNTLDIEKLIDGMKKAEAAGQVGQGIPAQGRITLLLNQQARIELEGADFTSRDLSHSLIRQLLDVPKVQESHTGGSVDEYIKRMTAYAPRIKDDTTGRVYERCKLMLQSKLSNKLYRLLFEHSYWNVINPWAKAMGIMHPSISLDNDGNSDDESTVSYAFSPSPSKQSQSESIATLSKAAKERLFLDVESTLMALQGKMGYTKEAIATMHQSLICCCHFVIDDLLPMVYPWFNYYHLQSKKMKKKLRKKKIVTDEQIEEMEEWNKKHRVCLKVRRLIHQSMSDLLDPSRIYSNHMLISSYVTADHKAITKASNKAKYYTTSIALRSVFGDAGDDRTRRFMKHAEDPYRPVPGIPRKFDEKTDIDREAEVKEKDRKIVERQGRTEMRKMRSNPPLQEVEEGYLGYGRNGIYNDNTNERDGDNGNTSDGNDPNNLYTDVNHLTWGLGLAGYDEADSLTNQIASASEEKKSMKRMELLSLTTPLAMSVNDSRRASNQKVPSSLKVGNNKVFQDTNPQTSHEHRSDIKHNNLKVHKVEVLPKQSGKRHSDHTKQIISTIKDRAIREEQGFTAKHIDLNLNRATSIERYRLEQEERKKRADLNWNNIFDDKDNYRQSVKNGDGNVYDTYRQSMSYLENNRQEINNDTFSRSIASKSHNSHPRTVSFAEGASMNEGSMSVLSLDTQRSVVDNHRANFKISVSCKSQLMNLLVKQKVDAYSDIEHVRKQILRTAGD